MRRLRFVVQPSLLALHAVTVALVVTTVLLGRWQLTVSEDKGLSLQNLGYVLQWWAFSIFVVGMWTRSMRDAYRTHVATGRSAGAPGSAGTWSSGEEPARPCTIGPPPVAYRRYVMPTMMHQTDDPVHTAYNNYLAQIAAAHLTTEDLR